ncbi:unnamed protein product, partial [Pylaiella littoralis]
RSESTCGLGGCQEQRLLEQQVLYDFCCRGHAQLAKARGEWPRPDSQGLSRCSLPGCKDVAYCNPDTGKASQYCSMRHVNEAKGRECRRNTCPRTAFFANMIGPQCCSRACFDEENGSATMIGGKYFGEVNCGLPGCGEKALRVEPWSSLQYCCEAHRVFHVRLRGASCSIGHPGAETYTTKVMEYASPFSRLELHFLDVGHPEYRSLAHQFTSKWLPNATEGVEIVRVIKIKMPREIRKTHEEYKTMVPNIRRRFHGTHCSSICSFYVGGSMCLQPDCRLCNISMHGFKIKDTVGTSPARNGRSRWLMYGRGIYFSSFSNKADFFAKYTAKQDADGKEVRCMLVADVAAGNALVTTDKDFPQMTEPPTGYHSIVGEVGPNLKSDELVVYDEAAALPTHFVVYRQ